MYLLIKACVFWTITYRANCANGDVTRSKDFSTSGKKKADCALTYLQKRKKQLKI
jgi:hypothetical protein